MERGKLILLVGGIGLLAFALIVGAALILRRPRPDRPQVKEAARPREIVFPKEPVTLTVWHLFDDIKVFEQAQRSYQQAHKNVTIHFERKDPRTYEDELIEALAAKRGPDIFLLRHNALPRHLDKLAPAPAAIFTPEIIKKEFVPVVSEEVVFAERVFGLPLYLDSLALYWNRRLFQKEQLFEPPDDWHEVVEVAKKLTKRDGAGRISQAGIALGRADNVARSFEILSALMIQNGSRMVTADRRSASFHLPLRRPTGEDYYPGVHALEFYTAFARPDKETFSWPADFPESTRAFLEGKLGMLIHFSFFQQVIQQEAPNLPFAIAPLPQIRGSRTRVDLAFTWYEVVSKQSAYPEVAWDFLRFLSSQEGLSFYSSFTQRPSPRRASAERAAQLLGQGTGGGQIFQAQALTATSWFVRDPREVEEVFRQMIEAVVEGRQTAAQAAETAAASTTNILGREPPLVEPPAETFEQ